MKNSIVILPDNFAKACFEKYNSLPKSGKCKENEWTVLSCIILSNRLTGYFEVIALGTGTKVLGSDQLCAKGWRLNDSHAEIIARRGFLRFLYAEIQKDAGSKILEFDKSLRKFKVKPEISFHFFSTHPPCGDATIPSTNSCNEIISDFYSPSENKRKKLEINNEPSLTEAGEPLIYTGAKILDKETADPMIQTTGCLRIKPGRGVRTLSMSCSDKISKWNVLGIQGNLLHMLIAAPVYLETYTFCDNSNQTALERAIWSRWCTNPVAKYGDFECFKPNIFICSPEVKFKHEKTGDKYPCPTSISWCHVEKRSLEVSVNGQRLGVTKKKLNKESSSLQISKAFLFRKFLDIVETHKLFREYYKTLEITNLNYKQVKELNINYKNMKDILIREIFKTWSFKPESLLHFIDTRK